ncbi:winged helix-turn-helix domain-containing protein (plasmid) [Natrinema thermotolerans]|nr:winged helix-turn-helix domain-containing protein [Natrinema thermotolerans]
MSDRPRDDDTQQFEAEYTDGDFLEAVRNCTVPSTSNIAEAVGCRRRTALRRLKKLEDQGEIGSETLGGGSKVWTRRI